MEKWHSLEVKEVIEKLKTNPETGLSFDEAKKRLEKFGFNELKEVKKRTLFQIFIEQFKDIFILLLLVATVLSAFVGYWESRGAQKGILETYADSITIF
ncbi:MAG: cation-transporting P-type ATPase, partial [Minisyncoccales bacterium]